jgi:phosphoesterase RecJ-like protein
LLRLGKKAITCSAGPFKRVELKNYIKYFTDLPKKKDKDTRVIIVDCSTMERTGELEEFLKNYPFAIIDHHAAATHPRSTPEAPVYVDSNTPSCTLLIEKLINALGLELTQEEANLLLLGLCTDTGFFRHLTENSCSVFEATAKMVRQGASPKKIYNIMMGGKSLNSRILLGHILSKIESYHDGKLLFSYETLEETNAFGLEGRDSDLLNSILLSIEGVQATVIIRQEFVDNCTVSLRSIDEIDVAQIAVSFGGGGHKNASGLTMQGNISSVKEKILNSFSKIFTQ